MGEKKGLNLRVVFGLLYAVFGLYFLNGYFNFVDLSSIVSKITDFSKFVGLITGALLIVSAFMVLRKKKDAYAVGR
jgi:Na+/alanine symporter